MDTQTNLKTLSVRVRDKHSTLLRQWAFEVNQVWNEANSRSAELSWVPIPGVGWMNLGTSAFDLQKDLKSFSKERAPNLHSHSVQEVIAVHAKSRKQFKTNKLRWRCSGGAKRALGWVPFKVGSAVWKDGQVRFNGHFFKVWDSYGLSQYKFRSGSFSEDSRGRWYFNVAVEVQSEVTTATKSVGIDLGLKEAAVASDGSRVEGRNYRALEAKLGIAQRAKKKNRVRAIHAKIKNRRKDQLHKFSTALVKENAAIFVGNVSSQKLVKTKMAKSTLDAGWGQLKTMLEYKCHRAGSVFEVVNEAYTTQTCSCCGVISTNSPKGRAGLRKREWTCVDCGTTHDRDLNAAKNILAAGHCRLEGGIPAL
jgi:IS605 OrfB family transposase